MSLFDVEPWSSDKTTDNLNKKLFEGGNPKLPQKRKTPLKNGGGKKIKLSVPNDNDIDTPSIKRKGRPKLTEEEKKKKKIQSKRKRQKFLKQQKKEEIRQKKNRNRYQNLSQDGATENEGNEESNNTQEIGIKKKSEKKKIVNGKEKHKKNKEKNGSTNEEEAARLLKKKEKRMKEKMRRKEKVRALKAKEAEEKAENNSNIEKQQDDSVEEGTPKEGKKKRKRKAKKNKFKEVDVDDKKIDLLVEENKKKQKQNIVTSSQKNKEKNKKTKSVENQSEENLKKKTKNQVKLGKTKALQQSEKKDKTNIKKQNGNNVSNSPKMSQNSPNSKQKKSPFSVDKLKEVLASQKVDTDSDDNSDDEDDDNDSSDDSAPQQQETQSLRERMQEKLNSARFRYLNQQLYSITSKDAKQLFANDRNAFKVYHQGFTSQVTKWPVNPVDNMIAYIKKRPQSLVVADFGCGDAKIARSVGNKVHSFDLVAVNDHITACDISKVPLGNGSVDIVVFCLALMGTNLTEFLREAHRVLKLGATMLIAEVASRFDKIASFAKKLEKLGFTVKNTDTSNKMFVWLEVKKTKAKPDASAPSIELLPCVYKKR